MRTELTDGTILIRQYREEDIDAIVEAARESWRETFPWLPWCKENYSREESALWVNARNELWNIGKEYSFVIADPSTEKFLGTCGLEPINQIHRYTSLGYWVRTREKGRGVASRAAKLAVQFGFEDIKLNRIEIMIACGNLASKRVAEKVGARYEGVLRNRLYLHDEAHDAFLYSFVREDL